MTFGLTLIMLFFRLSIGFYIAWILGSSEQHWDLSWNDELGAILGKSCLLVIHYFVVLFMSNNLLMLTVTFLRLHQAGERHRLHKKLPKSSIRTDKRLQVSFYCFNLYKWMSRYHLLICWCDSWCSTDKQARRSKERHDRQRRGPDHSQRRCNEGKLARPFAVIYDYYFTHFNVVYVLFNYFLAFLSATSADILPRGKVVVIRTFQRRLFNRDATNWPLRAWGCKADAGPTSEPLLQHWTSPQGEKWFFLWAVPALSTVYLSTLYFPHSCPRPPHNVTILTFSIHYNAQKYAHYL